MADNYLPGRDAQFTEWSQNFLAAVQKDPTDYGLSLEDMTELADKVTEWTNDYSAMNQKRDAAKAATAVKDDSRKALTATIRNFARQIQADPNVSKAKIGEAGLPIHSDARTPVPAPTTAPACVIEACNVREHVLRFTDSDNPTSRVRPKGVLGVDVWVAVSDVPPVDDGQYQMYTMATRMSTNVAFDQEQAGQTAWYKFRYVGSRGELGPWSMGYSATILK